MSDDQAPDDSKLTRTKQKWAELGKFLTGHASRREETRLPPGQHLVKNWPVLDLGIQPQINRETWTLDVDGEVEQNLHWHWTDYIALPQSQKVSDIHCVTTWSRYDNQWDGVSTHDFLDIVGVKDSARHVILHSSDGYTTNLALEDFATPEGLLAHSWMGAPLTAEHGGPVRLIIPHLYFWKSAKWIKRIQFVREDHPGFWEARGYHNRGDPWLEERYS